MDDGKKGTSLDNNYVKKTPGFPVTTLPANEGRPTTPTQKLKGEFQNVMKTLSDSFAKRQPSHSSSSDSDDDAVPSPDADSSRSSRSTNLMEQFLSEMDQVFTDILAEEDIKSFRHSMQTVSDTSPELAMTLTLEDVFPNTSVQTPDQLYRIESDTKSPEHTRRKSRPRIVVPLAVLEEFSEGSSSRDIWSTDDISDDRLNQEGSSDTEASDEEDNGKLISIKERRSNFRKRIQSKPLSLNGPVINDSCIVDMNSNAKDQHWSEQPVVQTYEDLERTFLGKDADDDECEEMLHGDCPMLGFAERYFNVHVIHTGYPNAITKTVSLVTRKSLNEVVPIEDLIRYTRNSTIVTSHVRLLDTDNVPLACSIFKDIHRFMRGELKTETIHSTISSIVAHGINQMELRDELFCQLARLSTDNPNDDMRLRIWILFALCSVSFGPSVTLKKYLVCYLQRVIDDEVESKASLYAKYCLRLITAPRLHTRKFPPSCAEIEAMSNLQPLVFRIYFLDGKTKAITLDPSEVASSAIAKVAEKIGLANTSGWALYESIPEHDRYIKDHEFLADVLSNWEEKQKVVATVGTPKKSLPKSPVQSYGKLVLFKRFCQKVTDIGEDIVELRLLYAQAVHYVVHLDEFQSPSSIALHLAGLQAQADYGNFDESKLSRYSEPEELLCQRVLTSESRDFSLELAAAHKRYGKGKSIAEAMRKYLTIVSQFPLYGCTKVFAHYRGLWPYGIETVLAVNYDGFKLISIQDKRITFDLSYSEIEEIILCERYGECHVIFQLKDDVLPVRQKTFLFECLELEDLAGLIEFYSPKHAIWSNQTGRSWRKYQFMVTDDWHKLHDNILRCRRVLVQNGIVKHPPHEEIGFLRSAFNRISGRNCSGSSRHDQDVEMDDLNEIAQGSYWSFSKVPFKTSLLAGQPHEIEDTAVRMFNSTLVYTGLELSAALDDMDLVVVVQTLITKCMENSSLCNEFCLQLIKQSTDMKSGAEHKSKNPILIESNQKALNQYWHLMTMATCVMLPPDPTVFAYLNLHLKRICMQIDTEEGKFAQFCLKSLHRTFENHGRKYPPSYKEILFVTKRQPIECRVYLADGHPMLVEFDSASTADEVIQIVKAKSGLRLDAFGFGLFQCIGDREDYIAGNVKLADCLYQWEKSSRSNHSSSKDLKLIFKKRLFLEPFVNFNDPVEIDLLYHQSVTDVFEQKIPLTKSDAVQLCALRAQAEYGDFGHANNFDYNSVVRILPRHLRELMVLKEISAVHITLAGTSPLQANIAFLEILKQWPLYGAILYEVSHSTIDYLPKTLWLAISQLGVHLMEYKGQTVYSTYTFDEIVDPLTAANKNLTITIANSSHNSLSFVFWTPEANQILLLINDYREVLAQRRKFKSERIIPSLPDDAIVHAVQSRVLRSHNRREQSMQEPASHRHGRERLQKSAKYRDSERTLGTVVKLTDSPTTSPERIEPLVSIHTSQKYTTSGAKGATHTKYQRVKDGSRNALKQSPYRATRRDSKPDGMFE